jgi:hypothetical protein
MQIVRATILHPGFSRGLDESGSQAGDKESRYGHRNAVARLDDRTVVHLHDKGWRHVVSPCGKTLHVVQLHRFRNNWIKTFPKRDEVVYGILSRNPPKYGQSPELIAWCRADSYEKPLKMIAARQSFTNQDDIRDHIIELIRSPKLNIEIWKDLMTELGCSKEFIAAVLAHYFVGMPASEVNRIFAPS